MKQVFLTLLFLSILCTCVRAQKSDYALVEQTVGYYLDGGTNRDYATLKKAFHPTAMIKIMGKDGYMEANCLEFFSGMKPGEPVDRKTRVVSIDVTGYVASAILEIEYATFTFVDYMTLMKIDDTWQVVSKVAYRRNHEAK